MSTGLPSVSPITPENSDDDPHTPALSSGGYMEEDGGSEESEQEERLPQGNGLHGPLSVRIHHLPLCADESDRHCRLECTVGCRETVISDIMDVAIICW